MSTNTPISKACGIVGGLSMLARLLGVKPPTVSQWLSNARPVPVERCFAIEKATNGAVTRRDLRPDDWAGIWPELQVSGAHEITLHPGESVSTPDITVKCEDKPKEA